MTFSLVYKHLVVHFFSGDVILNVGAPLIAVTAPSKFHTIIKPTPGLEPVGEHPIGLSQVDNLLEP